ncbi:MAG: hypothetical protein GX838_01555 [Clostridiaceae bacterium]|nr:hypothetical protein [Clostridiaceae bacterium]
MREGKRTLADTLHLGFSMISCDCMEEIKAHARRVPLRPGFEELLDLAKEKEIPVVVISGNLKPCIEQKLVPYRNRLLDVHSVN